MDGVLIDSEALWRRAHSEAVQSLFSLTVDSATFDALQGLRPRQVIEELSRRLSVGSTILDKWEEIVLQKMIRNIETSAVPIASSCDLVKSLGKRGYSLAIASSSPPALINATLRRLGLAYSFDAVVSAFSLKAGKPNPEIYLEAARKLSANPSCCVVIEDSPVGIEAAVAAGMLCIGFWTSAGDPPHEFAACNLVVPDLSRPEVLQLIEAP